MQKKKEKIVYETRNPFFPLLLRKDYITELTSYDYWLGTLMTYSWLPLTLLNYKAVFYDRIPRSKKSLNLGIYLDELLGSKNAAPRSLHHYVSH